MSVEWENLSAFCIANESANSNKLPISPSNVNEIICGVNETLKLKKGVYHK